MARRWSRRRRRLEVKRRNRNRLMREIARRAIEEGYDVERFPIPVEEYRTKSLETWHHFFVELATGYPVETEVITDLFHLFVESLRFSYRSASLVEALITIRKGRRAKEGWRTLTPRMKLSTIDDGYLEQQIRIWIHASGYEDIVGFGIRVRAG